MTYYEELGIEPDASEAEIRNSLIALSRVLEPDLHPRGRPREVAAAQMKRVSEMVDTLCDPIRRAEYDARLCQANVRAEQDPWWFWGLGISALAGMVCWLWWMVPADRHAIVEEEPILLTAPGVREEGDGWVKRSQRDDGNRAKAIGVRQAQNGLIGHWRYEIDPQDMPAQWATVAERVDLKVRLEHGEWFGSYHSRHKIPGRTTKPEVNFQFRGPLGAREFEWAYGPNKGRIELKLQANDVLEANWRVLSQTSISGMTAGSATLLRFEDGSLR